MASIVPPLRRRHVDEMRFLLALGLSFTLAACATTTAPPVETQPAQTVTTEAPSAHLAAMLASAGRADAPSRAMVERAFGAADIVRQDGAGAALTYRLESCALLLLFTADANNEMRLAEAHPSARRPGSPAPDLPQCAAEVAARGA